MEYLETHEDDDDNLKDIVVESHISKVLTERTNQIVIILILILLFVLPWFQSSQYLLTDTTMDKGMSMLVGLYDLGPE